MSRASVLEPSVVVQTAMGIEFEALRSGLDRVDGTLDVAGRAAVSGVMGDISLVLVKGGWGKVMAAASCQAALDRFHPFLVVDCGTAGGLTDDLQVGDLFVAESVLDAAMQTTWAATLVASDGLRELLQSCGRSFPCHRGALLNLEQTVDSRVERDRWRRLGFDAVAWEPFGLLKTAETNGVSALSLRVVSDMADEDVVETFQSHRTRFLERLAHALRSLLMCWTRWRDVSGRSLSWSHPSREAHS